MNNTLKTLIALFGYIFCAAANAEYVSERLFLGVYEQPDAGTTPVKTLSSGTAVTVLQRQGDFVQLQLADGTQGWARAEFISQDMPAKLVLEQVTDERDKLREQLRRMGNEQETIKQLQQELNQSAQTIKEMTAKLAEQQHQSTTENLEQAADQNAALLELQEKLATSQQSIGELQKEIDSLRSRSNGGGNPLAKIGWMLFSMLLFLAAGIWIGIRWLSGRVKQRFNGLKVW